MEANELRIGILIKSKHNDKIFKIQTFKDIELLYDICEPIPLTEEWLTKFGFHKTAEDDFDKTFGDIDQISIRSNKLYVTDKFGVYLNPKRIAIIQYVHQLQNLYFALTSEELTIKEK